MRYFEILAESSAPYRYLKCCVDFPSHGNEYDALIDMIDHGKEISYGTFVKAVGIENLAETFPDYDWSKRPRQLTLKKDYHVRYYKSRFHRYPCYYVVHSAIEYIFVPSNYQELRETNVSSPTFKEWFGDSKIVDKNGNPLKLYRGLFGPYASDPHEWMTPRKGYAAFFTPSPWLASTYATPDRVFGGTGAVYPVYIRANTLIEFPVKVDSDGYRRFDMFAFDDKARLLRPGEVLVVRNVCDIGPRANTKVDPEKKYSRPTDIYAVGGGTSIKSAVSESTGHTINAYHGTDQDIEAFSYQKSKGGSGSREGVLGFWFTDHPEVANQFAAWAGRGPHGSNVLPVKLKINHPLIVRSYDEIRDIVDRFTKFAKPNYVVGGRQLRMMQDEIDYGAAREWLKSQGYDGIILPDTVTDSPDGGNTKTTQFIVFDPSQIRSRFAKFNPAKADSDILTDGIDFRKKQS